MISFRRTFAKTALADEGKQNKIWDVAFDPLGELLLVATASAILILNAQNGEIIRKLTAHEGSVYSVAYCPDGQSFASGGQDGNVMFWTRSGEGVSRYRHNQPIQCLQYNPSTFDLTSATASDLCLWSIKHNKRSHKSNIPAKCLSMDWCPNGKMLALSLQNDTVVLYDKSGKQLHCITPQNDKTNHHNILSVKWFDDEMLMICSWSKTLSFYRVDSGRKVTVRNVQNTKLEFYPNQICCLQTSCLILCGLDGNLYLFTSQGTFVEKYGDDIQGRPQRDWILGISNHDKSNTIFYGTNHGHLVCNKVSPPIPCSLPLIG